MCNTTYLPKISIKKYNSDFIVEEIYITPSYKTVESSTYTYLYLQKEGISTFDSLRSIASYFGVEDISVSAAGLKDENAITYQLISIANIYAQEEIVSANEYFGKIDTQINISLRGYGDEAIIPRKLHGNKFKLIIRDVESSLIDSVMAILEGNIFYTFINYYDEQRFGLPETNHNTHLIGEALFLSEYKNFVKEYLSSGLPENEKDTALLRLQNHGAKAVIDLIENSRLNFFLSSYQSYLWNIELSKAITQGNSTFSPVFPYLGELPLSFGDIEFSHVMDISTYFYDKNNHKVVQGSTRKRPTYLTTAIFPKKEEDGSVSLSFILPTGCYATMLVKQLFYKASLNIRHSKGEPQIVNV